MCMVAIHSRTHLLDEVLTPSNIEYVTKGWGGMKDFPDPGQQHRVTEDQPPLWLPSQGPDRANHLARSPKSERPGTPD